MQWAGIGGKVTTTPIQRKMMTKHAEFTFGKHRGETLGQVLRNDPGYILWLHENGVVELPEDVVIEAEQLGDEQ